MLYDLIKNGFGTEENYNWAEKILYGANKVYDLGLDQNALKLSAGFGGGMGVGTTCGALTGGIMALSNQVVDTTEKTSDIKDIVIDFLNEYEDKMGTILCVELKEKYADDETKCRDIIFEATIMLDNIFTDLKK